MSSKYPFALARPRLGRRGEPSGTRERTAPSESPPLVSLSSSMQAYGSKLSTTRSFVCGPAARRRYVRILSRVILVPTRTARHGLLVDVLVRPIVQHRAEKEHIWGADGAYTWDAERLPRLEEVLGVEADPARREQLRMSVTPRLPHDMCTRVVKGI